MKVKGADGSWAEVAPVVGAKGPTGDQGPAGPAGQGGQGPRGIDGVSYAKGGTVVVTPDANGNANVPTGFVGGKVIFVNGDDAAMPVLTVECAGDNGAGTYPAKAITNMGGFPTPAGGAVRLNWVGIAFA